MYYTKVKYTSYAGFGITEGQMLAIISLLITGIYGQDLWGPTIRALILIFVIAIECFMSLFALIDTIKAKCSTPLFERFWEILPLAQFLVSTFIMTYTEFYNKYPALVILIMSLSFYLLNGKLVLSSVIENKIALFHLDLFYLWLPSIPLFIQNLGLIDSECSIKAQIWCGFALVVLISERVITCSIILVSHITKRLGYGFFDIPKSIETPK